MAYDVYVSIPKQVGDYRVQTGDLDLTGVSSVVGDVLGFIPGVGNTLEKTANFLGGAFTAIFGARKDEVRDVTRKILGQFFGGAFPGKIRFIGSARDVPELPDQYTEESIRRALDEIGRVVLSDLPPGSDIHGDLSLAFRSFQFSRTANTAGNYMVLKFKADPTAGRSTVPAPVDQGGGDLVVVRDPAPRTTPDTRSREHVETPDNRPTVDPGKPGGLSPVLLGLGVVGVLLLLRR